MIFVRLLSRLPLFILYRISDIIFVLVYYGLGYRKAVVTDNLTLCFPEKSATEIKKIRKNFYRRFCDFGVETIKSLTISEKELKKRVHFVNPDFMNAHIERGESVLAAACHQFNWEWGALASALHISVPIDPVYQSLRSKGFNQFMLEVRSRFGGIPIEKDSAVRDIVKNKARVRLIAMVADQTPPMSNSNNQWTKMFGRDTVFYKGLDTLAKFGKFPVYFFKIASPKRGYYCIEYLPMATPPYDKEKTDIVGMYAKMTEDQIRRDPSGWLWSHKRWKHKKEV